MLIQKKKLSHGDCWHSRKFFIMPWWVDAVGAIHQCYGFGGSNRSEVVCIMVGANSGYG